MRCKAKRGDPTHVYVFKLDGIRVCHLGDIGHLLSDKILKEIGKVDLLFVPIGGKFTLEPGKVNKLIDSLKPRVVLPIHYKTAMIRFPLAEAKVFLTGKRNVKKVGHKLSVNKAKLPATREIWMLDYE